MKNVRYSAGGEMEVSNPFLLSQCFIVHDVNPLLFPQDIFSKMYACMECLCDL